jgi:DNA-directed RNA polymerase subunit K/omega
MGKTQLTVAIAEELQQQAKAAAELRGESLTSVVSAALEDYVKKSFPVQYDAKHALQHDALLSLRFSGGPGDVAERAEEILQEASDPQMGLTTEHERNS